MRECTQCRTDRPLFDFGSDKYAADGLRSRCKPCGRAYAKKYRERNLERCALESREWRAKNKDRAAENFRRWREENPEVARAAQREWHARNPHMNAAYCRERKAKTLNAVPAWADAEEISRVYAVARAYRDAGVDVQVDHVVPLANKNVCGLHVADNLQIIFSSDNASKGNRWWPDMPKELLL